MTRHTHCPICQSANIKFHYAGRSEYRKDAVYDLSICGDCSHYFVDPVPSDSELLSYYNQSYQAYGSTHGSGAANIDELVTMVRKTWRFRNLDLRPRMSVLDVGCGGGLFLQVLKRAGITTKGIEPSEHGVRTCRAQGIDVFHGTVTDYIRENGTATKFDAITANHVVEHHHDPISLFKELSQLLAPNGKLWVAVPNAGTFFADRLRDNWYSLVLPIHLHHFNPKSAELAARKAGLSVERLYTNSADEVLWTTIKSYLRHSWKVPMRLTRLADPIARPIVRNIGKRRDALGVGEEIVLEARAA
jgi:2-polyprenyl-3-methyl-5-hydroxy-6-metoxy-1,4-benzoquinol methylase